MTIPMLIRIKVRAPEAHFRLFFPILLLYLLLALPYLLLSIAYCIMRVVARDEQVTGYLKICFLLPSLINAAAGTDIEVHSNDSDITITIN